MIQWWTSQHTVLLLLQLVWLATRVATIQCVDVSMHCFWCITIQWYIVRYKVESKHCFVLFLREINSFEKHYVSFRLITMYNNFIKTSHDMLIYHNSDISISIRFNFKTIRYTMYRYIIASVLATKLLIAPVITYQRRNFHQGSLHLPHLYSNKFGQVQCCSIYLHQCARSALQS